MHLNLSVLRQRKKYRESIHSRAALLDGICFLHAPLPIGKLLLRFLFGDAVSFLDLARKAVAFSRNHVKLIVGKLAPLLFDIALELLPVSLDAIPVHFRIL